MNEMIYIGKTVSTFGIKGELKVISDFEYCDRAYQVNKKILINNIEHVISGIRYHKNYVLLKIDNLNNINDILKYVGFNIYIKRIDLGLKGCEYLYKDLINSEVIDDDNTKLGKVIEVLNGNNVLIKVKGSKEFLIPLIDNYISKFDLNKKILDIGAGAGTYLINVAKNDNTVTGKMLDLPAMSKLQNDRIKENNLQNRLVSEECDYNSNFPIEKYDDVFLFAVVHQEHEENLKKLINNIYEILNPKGRLFLTSFFLNEDKISPKFAVQFAVEMIASSNDGKVYTFNEIEKILKTRFDNLQKIEDIPGPATLYIATK